MTCGGNVGEHSTSTVPSWSEDERSICSQQQRRTLDVNKLLLFISSLLGDRELWKPEGLGALGLISASAHRTGVFPVQQRLQLPVSSLWP